MPKKCTGPCYNLFLDDFRIPQDAFDYTKDPRYTARDWVIVHNYQDFVDTITEKYMDGQLPELISFDHDLGYEEESIDMTTPDYNNFGERSGYHCAKWLTDFCIDTDTKLPDYMVHSMNPVGRENILSLLNSFECEYCGGRGYHKMSCYTNKAVIQIDED
jgi:hypothetical protein